MKKVLPLLMISIIYSFIAACTSGEEKKAIVSTSLLSMPDSIDRISFVTAEVADQWVENYHAAWKKIVPQDSLPVKYFTVKTQDVLLAMGINKPWKEVTTQEYIRVNIGYDITSNQMKCFIQPVENVDLSKNYAGEGMYFNKNGQIVSKKPKSAGLNAKSKDAEPFFVADLNTPCPNTCGN